MSPIPGTGECTRRRATGEMLPGGSRLLQKGVQDTTKDVVSYTPSCDSP